MKYFGTDGIRGIPNKLLTVEFTSKVGMSLSILNNKNVYIATDTRISKDMIKAAIISGILSMGMNAINVGILPTPALIYYSKLKQATGIIITASHNPYYDNGIKIVNKGNKLTNEEELKIESFIDNQIINKELIGLYKKQDIKLFYYNYLSKYLTKTNLKIVIDCANGSTYKTAPYIFNKMTNKLLVLSNNPNGININNNCGSLYPQLLINTIKSLNYDIGFSFDGDGDRLLVVNNNGEIIDGDKILYLISLYLKSKNKLNNNTVVLSIMSNIGIINKLKENKINVIEANVGDKNIIEILNKNNLSLGGENSGHIIIPEILSTGDGLLTALLLIKIIEELNINLNTYFNNINYYPNKLINIKTNKNIINNKELISKINTIKNTLNNDCKIIVRPSGTEDLVRLLIMAKTKELVDKYSLELLNTISKINEESK